jgi:hypothetical protein
MQEILKCILVMRDVLCQHHKIHNCSSEVYCSRCIMCKKWCNHDTIWCTIVFQSASIHCFMLLYLWKIFNSAKEIEQNWWSSCVTSDALEILCLMSFFFLVTVMLFSISCFNQWTKYVTVLEQLMQYINHHCCINIDQMMSSCKVVNRVNSCSIILWYLLFLLSTDLVLDELMFKVISSSSNSLALWWYLTDHTLLIHLDTHNQYLFLIVYHEVCYHRMTLTALTVCTDYIKFIFDSESDCCLLSVGKSEHVIMSLTYSQV